MMARETIALAPALVIAAARHVQAPTRALAPAPIAPASGSQAVATDSVWPARAKRNKVRRAVRASVLAVSVSTGIVATPRAPGRATLAKSPVIWARANQFQVVTIRTMNAEAAEAQVAADTATGQAPVRTPRWKGNAMPA